MMHAPVTPPANPPVPAIAWRNGAVRFLDQSLLPAEERFVETSDFRDIASAIRSLGIRGAPLIGIAAAYAVALAAFEGGRNGRAKACAVEAIAELRGTRPTAVNLFDALDRVSAALAAATTDGDAADRALAEALSIHREDEAMCREIGRRGAELLPDPAVIVTHCNAGALATGGIGTALGVIITAAAAGKRVRVFAGETRPLFQGARLTAWELHRSGIDVTVVTDSSVPWLMAQSAVNAVVVGADRIAANGDVANKIGTYGLARAAADHGIPFYVAAPATTIDPAAADGSGIPIELRPAAEITSWSGRRIAPEGVPAWAPAFDVTPARYVTAIITESAVHRFPYAFASATPAASSGRTP